MKKKTIIIAGVLTATIVFGLGIYQSDASQGSPTLSQDEIISLVSAQYPGTIKEIELEKERNRAVYEIEIVNDGIEYELKVDGSSGEIIKLKEKKKLDDEKSIEVVEVQDKETETEKENKISETKKENKESETAKENKVSKTVEENKVSETKLEKKQVSPNNKKQADAKKEQKNKQTVISMEQAIAIAQKEFPGTVSEAELDEDDGRLIYEIEIEAKDEEAEFEIDAMTGEILVIEIDD